jgi:nicotinic acid phosphoribosyltransferase
VTLLVDTYDTVQGVRTASRVLRDINRGHGCAVPIDSGDLAELSRQARRVLDAADLAEVGIVASGGLDEYCWNGSSLIATPCSPGPPHPTSGRSNPLQKGRAA